MKLKVLLADDSREFLDALSGFLNSIDFVEIVSKAQSGEEAVSLCKELKPDLVLMDIAMPGMGGLEATTLIKGLESPPWVIFVTIYDTDEYMRAAKELGVEGFVPKSDLVGKLIPLLKELLSRKETEMKESTLSSKNILIVDDSRTIRKMVKASLEAAGFSLFTEAENGLEAIEKLALKRTHLMVLDLNMPDMNGMEVIQFVRSHPAYKKIPILVLTTKGDQTSKAMALSAGADQYMTKPFDPQTLSREVLRLLEKEVP